jgi:lipoate-protein ligase A
LRRLRLLELGTVAPARSQACYHAAAYVLDEGTPDTVILVSPSDPYVCIGFHQEVDREVDRAYCREHGLPVLRREVGGGAVYLDRDQVFVQWVFHPASLPAEVEARFRLYIEPLVRTYRALGVEAVHRPVNDVHVRGRKIGGTGAARIGRAEVVVGSLMFDFDRAAMARVLRLSSEKMRDKVFRGLQDYMTTMRDELGRPPDRDEVVALYLRELAAVFGAEIVPGEWTAAEESRARELDEALAAEDWLREKAAGRPAGVKIHEDVHVRESVHKAAGGLIRVTARLRQGRIDDIAISGDFTIYPREAVAAIEKALLGALADRPAVLAVVEDVYRALSVQSPGLSPADWAEAMALTVESGPAPPGAARSR